MWSGLIDIEISGLMSVVTIDELEFERRNDKRSDKMNGRLKESRNIWSFILYLGTTCGRIFDEKHSSYF